MQVFICVGILVAYIVGLPYDSNQPFAVSLFGRCVAWWRVIFGLGIVPALLQARFRCTLHLRPHHLPQTRRSCPCTRSVLMQEPEFHVFRAMAGEGLAPAPQHP